MIFVSDPQIDPADLFANANPVEIEIGSGKGAFLLAAAEANPGINFLGIENQGKYTRLTRERIEKRGLPNARVLHADAAWIVSRFLRDETVSAYHVYFPDPWWKRRHHKRRLITREMGSNLFRTLRRGGTLWLGTDVAFRFDEMLAELSSFPFEVRVGERFPERPLTNFEHKYAAQGRPLHYAALRKPEKRNRG